MNNPNSFLVSMNIVSVSLSTSGIGYVATETEFPIGTKYGLRIISSGDGGGQKKAPDDSGACA